MESGRSRRQNTGRVAKLANTFDKIKKLKGSKNKYELHDEAPVYDMVDDDEYAELVVKRQKDDWIVDDDGIGDYVEDGREVFDDDLDEGDCYEGDIHAAGSKKGDSKKNKKKIPIKRKSDVADLSEDDEEPISKKSHSLIKLFKKINDDNEMKAKTRRVKEVKTTDDDMLEDILSDLHSDAPQTSAHATSNGYTNLRPNKLKKRVVPARGSPSAISNPFASQSVLGTRRTLSDIKKSMGGDNFDSFLSQLSPGKGSSNGTGVNVGASMHSVNNGEDLFDDDDGFLDLASSAVITKPAKKQVVFNTDWEFGEQNNDLNEPTTSAVPIPDDIDKDLQFFSEGKKGERFLKFYWLDAHESPFVTPGTVYVFGKVYMKSSQRFVSCCCLLKDIERRLFLLPREWRKSDKNVKVEIGDVYSEFNSMAKRFKIQKFKSRPVKKLYAFDKKDVPLESEYLEILVPSKATIPIDLEGDTFSCVFGSNQSALERVIIDLKLRGPGWLKIKNPGFASSPVSWCKVELTVDKLNQLYYDSEDKTKAPPLTLISISLRTFVNPQNRHNEIVAISCLIERNFDVERGCSSAGHKQQFDTHFCAITKPSAACGVIFPYDFVASKVGQSYRKTKLEVKGSEREMLNWFMARFFQIDADIIVGHDIHNFDIDVLLTRLAHYKVATWSKLGRLRRSNLPSLKKRDKANATAGRIVADLKISAKELIKAKSYDLTELVSQVLKKNRQEIDGQGLSSFYSSAKHLFDLITLTMMDNNFILSIILELQVLPLALQITKVAGNILSRTLLGGRSERNEFLLLHAFTEKNYIVPDKTYGKKADVEIPEGHQIDDEVLAGEATKANVSKSGPVRKKAAYAGGLVLEPKVGFYNDFVLILDFNSLYPTIMREFNICFTTVHHRNPILPKEGEDGDALPPLPEPELEMGILPDQITKLVQRRGEVKKLMQLPSCLPEQKAQLNITQLALKLTANSMYGCLGFGMSRFYAKPLAALITYKGREILMATKTLVEGLGFEVIYGDTDSIMINTHSGDYEEAYKIATKVQSSVNGLYKYLEIECDGVLKSMLLLKKKKYAALVVSHDKGDKSKLNYTKEMKGLDIVRRDWSIIAKKAGEQVVDHILALDRTQEVIVDNIHSFLKDLGDQVRANSIPLEEFIITKALTKNPEDYPDKKNLSHVAVALRFNSTNKSGKKLSGGDTVPYIICVKKSNPLNFNGLPATQRAFHPDEVTSDPFELEVDFKYYLSQQIHPVVTRLVDPIDGTDASVIAEMLGLESSNVNIHGKKEDPAEALLGIGETRFDSCKVMSIKCPKPTCGKLIEVRKMFTEVEPTLDSIQTKKKLKLTLSICPHCAYDLSIDAKAYKNMANHLRDQCRQFVNKYYAGWMTCEDPICDTKTRLSTGPMTKRGPLCHECAQAALVLDYTEAQLFLQFSYYEYLLDWKAAEVRPAEDTMRAEIKVMTGKYQHLFNALTKVVTEFKDSMAFNQVNLGYLFKKQTFVCMRG